MDKWYSAKTITVSSSSEKVQPRQYPSVSFCFSDPFFLVREKDPDSNLTHSGVKADLEAMHAEVKMRFSTDIRRAQFDFGYSR